MRPGDPGGLSQAQFQQDRKHSWDMHEAAHKKGLQLELPLPHGLPTASYSPSKDHKPPPTSQAPVSTKRNFLSLSSTSISHLWLCYSCSAVLQHPHLQHSPNSLASLPQQSINTPYLRNRPETLLGIPSYPLLPFSASLTARREQSGTTTLRHSSAGVMVHYQPGPAWMAMLPTEPELVLKVKPIVELTAETNSPVWTVQHLHPCGTAWHSCHFHLVLCPWPDAHS